MSKKIEKWQFHKPGCNGCKYQGTDLPCEYILITGNSPKSQGAHIDPEGDGGCELYEKGNRGQKKVPMPATVKSIRRQEADRKIDYSKAMELYEQGKVDKDIAEEFGVTAAAVYRWRRKYALKPNGIISTKTKGQEDERWRRRMDLDEVMMLYNQGDTDKEIAEKIGAKRKTVQAWRKRMRLTPNKKAGSRSKIEHETALKMYKDGASDVDIAKVFGALPAAALLWRKRNNLPANYDNNGRRVFYDENGNRIVEEKKPKAKKMPPKAKKRLPKSAKHGRWIKTTQENGCAEWTEFECSVCGAVFDGNERLFDKWKGCPVCLSRLDGGADNG